MINVSILFFQSELPGFYDPCVGEEKTLKIDYVYNETDYSLEIRDNENLRLPASNASSPVQGL